MKQIAKILVVLMLALCLLTTLISCGDTKTEEPTTEDAAVTPGDGSDGDETPVPETDPLVNKESNTETGWSDVK